MLFRVEMRKKEGEAGSYNVIQGKRRALSKGKGENHQGRAGSELLLGAPRIIWERALWKKAIKKKEDHDISLARKKEFSNALLMHKERRGGKGIVY